MQNKVINLNNYKGSSYGLMKKISNSDFFSNDSTLNVNCHSAKTESYISFDLLVGFIIEYGVNFHELQSEEFGKYMLEYHKTIIFYGVKYYLPCTNKYNSKEQKIFDYLIENFLSE